MKPAPPPVPGTPESFVSKVGLTMTDAMPSFDSGDGTGTPSGDGAALERTPLERLGVTFATTAETVRNHTAWAIALGVIVAWLALRGLGRTRRREAGNSNENGAAYRSG